MLSVVEMVKGTTAKITQVIVVNIALFKSTVIVIYFKLLSSMLALSVFLRLPITPLYLLFKYANYYFIC